VLLRQLLALLHVRLELVLVEAELLREAEHHRATGRALPALLAALGVLVELVLLEALVPERRIHLVRLALLGSRAERERAGGGDLRVNDELLVDDAQIVAVLLAELVHRVADALAVRARVVVRLDERDLRIGRAVERIAVDRHRVRLRAIRLGARRTLRSGGTGARNAAGL